MQEGRLRKKTKNEKVAVMNASIKLGHPKATTLAGYFSLYNVGSETLTIESIQSPLFKKVELHDMSMEGGMMNMKRIESIQLKPGENLVLEPGGKHLMMMKPTQPLALDEMVEVKLNFFDGSSQAIIIKVVD
jgi:copper(I)-binding protein